MKRDKKPYKILVIEDNPGDFALIKIFLTEQITTPVIVHAEDFKQAVSILAVDKSSFDVILLDLSLPDKSDRELIVEMLGISGSCPIIILTGFTDIDFSVNSISLGISDYLYKDELNATILYKSIIYSIERKKTTLQLYESEKAKEEVTFSFEKEKELNQMKSRFVSMASHEFRTPLSAIQLSAVLIEKYTQQYENSNITKHIGKIKRSVGDLTAILNDFLSLERLDAQKITPTLSSFDLEAFSTEIAEEMQMITKLNQVIIYKHTGLDKEITLDQNLLKNCVNNLIANAIKYSGEDTFIEFSTVIDDQKCEIIVKDNGIGIPENDQKYLFEPFFRAQNTGNIPGTGLGLNIVLRYIRLMNGVISFESSEKMGTRFTISFLK